MCIRDSYYTEQESGEFDLARTLTSYRKPGETVTYGRPARNGYVTSNEGTSGSLTVTEDGPNTADVYYYLDTDNNDKPDTYTVTLTFQDTGYGSWDIEDTMWEQMKAGKDYIYDTDSRACLLYTSASWYGVVQTYTVSEITPFFWEDECVMFYVRSGSGFLRVNQTLYPLSQGCFCSMHQFHVFRFEASSEAVSYTHLDVYKRQIVL